MDTALLEQKVDSMNNGLHELMSKNEKALQKNVEMIELSQKLLDHTGTVIQHNKEISESSERLLGLPAFEIKDHLEEEMIGFYKVAREELTQIP